GGERRGRGDGSRSDACQTGREKKENNGNHTDISSGKLHTQFCDFVEGAVDVRLAEKQSYRDQNDEQADRKTRHYFGDLHAAQKHSDDEGKGNREESNVDLRHAANDDGHRKCNNRKNWKEAHGS